MKPDRKKAENRVRGLGRSMRSIAAIEKDFKNPKAKITLEEERLLDLFTFQKTGKHIGRFKEKKQPNKPNYDILKASVPAGDAEKLVEVKTKKRNNPTMGGRGPLPTSESVS